MKKKALILFWNLFLLGCSLPELAFGQHYLKTLEESDVYFNQQIARFSNGDILIGDSFLGPLMDSRENGKIVMARLDDCGQKLWAYSYSLNTGYLEFRDFFINQTDEIIAYGSYFDGSEEVLFLLSINGKTGKRAVFRLYDPKTINGYFAYTLNKVDNQFMVYGFLVNPNTGLIAYFDESLQVLSAKKITPFQPNGAAIISRDKNVVARSGKYLFKLKPNGDFDWKNVSNIPAVNGPIEVPSGFILVGHQEGISFFFKIDDDGQLRWKSEQFEAIESSGAMSLLADGNLLFSYNCPSTTGNKLCQLILTPNGKITEQRQLNLSQTINSGLLKQSITDSNVITIAGNANAFVPEQAEIKDFLMQFSLDVSTDNCMSWESFQATSANTFDLTFDTVQIIAEDFDMIMIERSSATMDTFFYPLTELCGETLEPNLISRDTLLPCREDWLVELPNNTFSWLDGSSENPRLLETTGVYKAKNNDCMDPLEIEFRLEKQDCGCPNYLPNAFSPNNDGINDNLIFYSECSLDHFQMSVFNRFGGRIFYSDTVGQFWDGRYQQKKVEVGIYIVLIQYQWTDYKGVQHHGQIAQDVMLLR